MKRREFLKSTALYTSGIMTWGSFLSIGGCSLKDSNKDILNLAGTWNFQLDPDDLGIEEGWFKKQLRHKLELPGSIQEQGFGEDVTLDTDWMVRSNYYESLWFTSPIFSEYREPDNFYITEWLQPEKHYIGPAWFQREVNIPEELKNERIILHMERCHWETTLWINGEKIGSRNSLAAHHEYDLTDVLTPGKNTFSIRVDNSMIVDVGPNAHSVTDHTQSAWNGIIGQNELRSSPKIWIDDVQVYPDVNNKTAELHITLGNLTNQGEQGKLEITALSFNSQFDHQVNPLKKSISIPDQRQYVEVLSLPLGENMQLWNEFNPALYQLNVNLDVQEADDTYTHTHQTLFGMREVKVEKQNILLNGQNLNLRGNLECCVFPKTGYPPTDIESWRKIYEKQKEYGINHVRFHSWCPPEAAFIAADEVGIYIQPEVNVWKRISKEDQFNFLLEESKQILEKYGNHPSFLMMGLGNEGHCKKSIMEKLLSEWQQDERHIYTGLANSNGSIINEYDYYIGRKVDSKRIRFQSGWPPKPEGNWLLSNKPNTNTDFQETASSFDKPLISHEIGQRCTYPSLDQTKKYTGSFSAGYLKIAEDQLEKRGMSDQWKDFINASGRWQIELYKEEIEACLRTSDLSGFQLLQLNDFPGQSGALVGILDAFWDEKGYCNPEYFKSFCSPTVPLARMDKRVWTNDDIFTANLQLSHYGENNHQNVHAKLSINDDEGNEMFSETKKVQNITSGKLHKIGQIEHDLSSLPAPGRYTLHADFENIAAGNSWNFWVFPSKSEIKRADHKNISIEHAWNNQVNTKLGNGENILLQLDNESIKGDLPPCFLPMYWTQFGLNEGESQSMGLLCDPSHPVFANFPTEGHTNWHWWELLSETKPLIFDSYDHQAPWPKSFRPLVQLIDGWETNRKLGVLAEAHMGNGKIVICSMNLTRSLQTRPVARQFRKSLLVYMNSSAFNPKTEINTRQIEALLKTS